ncbi:MAG TPA: DUF2851 family protein [Chitinophagaceae bacterium]|nr:DUF2851 family protein [Chitinophagaceae bacterium]HPH32510.1 DUF2851 family protein [Chitinophagaceae bacterium]HPN60443.1 DUF2851 family protein [Chitinophagaceae bacterium]
MNERLLQYIWQFQYFAAGELLTTTGEPVQVIQQGQYNTNQGPDFSSAKIKIAGTTWVGSVELHIRSSDWDKHKHQHDRNYDNVILHVVWEEDGWNYPVPVLELKGRVPGLLLNRYALLMENPGFIPCEKNITGINELSWTSWKDRLLSERLERKSGLMQQFLEQNGNHWEEATWWMMARNFGIKVNTEAFESIARSLPVSLLSKQKHQLILLEALLMGQAGLLGDEKPGDKYYTLLQREYRFQQTKYQLRPIAVPIHFLRMRPGNFPTVRLAQLAVLLFQSESLFAKIKETRSLEELKQFFNITANDYWHYHYSFDEASPYKPKRLGSVMLDNLIINTLCPLLFTYGSYHREQEYKDRAVQWLEQTTAESNTVTRGYSQLGVANKNAFDSQALIELKQSYCDQKRCLECAVGATLLRSQESVVGSR